MRRAQLRRYGALDRTLNVQRVRLACSHRAPPRSWTLLIALAELLRQAPGYGSPSAERGAAAATAANDRRTISTPVRMTIGMMTSSVEIAVSVGSISYRTLSHIRLGSVVVAGPPRKIASTTSSNDRRKATAAPETTDGKMAGSVT